MAKMKKKHPPAKPKTNVVRKSIRELEESGDYDPDALAKLKGHQHHYGEEHQAGVHAEKGKLLVKKCACGDRVERYEV